MRDKPHLAASSRLAAGLGLVVAVGCGDPSSAGVAADTTGSETGSSTDTTSGSSPTTSGSGEPADSSGDGDGTGTSETGEPEPSFDWNLPPGIPEPWVPEDNPMTAEKVALGRHLFYETRLSGNETQACSGCHEQSLAFADGKALPTGSTGEVLARNSMGLTNAGYSFPLTWANPLLPTLEQQILVPLFGEFPVELGVSGNEEEILQRLRDDESYQALFADAFPDLDDPFTFERVRQALACFIRTMISANSRFDQYTYQGDLDALTEPELRGLDLFFSENLECHHCHFGFNFSGATKHANTTHDPSAFHNTGLYNIGGEGDYPVGNQGLIETTFEPKDMGRFRAVTLRNLSVTGPYLHDGSAETLQDVIRFYERGGRLIEDGPLAGDGALNPYRSGLVAGFTLTDQERQDLVAFLNALTDEGFLTDPALSDPFAE